MKVKDNFEIETLNKILAIKEGDYFDKEVLKKSLSNIEKFLREDRVKGAEVSHTIEKAKEKVALKVFVSYEDLVKVEEVFFKGDWTYLSEDLLETIKGYKNKDFDNVKFIVQREKIKRFFFVNGFYDASISLKFLKGKKKNTKSVLFHIHAGKKTNINFRGHKYIDRIGLIKKIRKNIQDGYKIDESLLRKNIVAMYEDIGFYGTKVSIRKRVGELKDGVDFENFYITIKEGERIDLVKVDFRGNRMIKNSQLKKLFDKSASPLTSHHHLDLDFLEKFSDILGNFFLEKGVCSLFHFQAKSDD